MNETFQKLWFSPTPSRDEEAMNRKILNITDVVRTVFHLLKMAKKLLSLSNSWWCFGSLIQGVGMQRFRLRLVWAASAKCESSDLFKNINSFLLVCFSLFSFIASDYCWTVIAQLLKSEEDASYKPTKKACVQLVDNLVEHILKYEESIAGKLLNYINKGCFI